MVSVSFPGSLNGKNTISSSRDGKDEKQLKISPSLSLSSLINTCMCVFIHTPLQAHTNASDAQPMVIFPKTHTSTNSDL